MFGFLFFTQGKKRALQPPLPPFRALQPPLPPFFLYSLVPGTERVKKGQYESEQSDPDGRRERGNVPPTTPNSTHSEFHIIFKCIHKRSTRVQKERRQGIGVCNETHMTLV